MGLHTGEVLVVDGGGLRRASRSTGRRGSRAAAHGGQVILTDATRSVAGEPGAGIALRDLGEHRLKDFARPERLYQVEAAGLETTFPALAHARPHAQQPAAAAHHASSAGRRSTGRSTLLDRTRLLTLTGPGGTGQDAALAGAGERLRRALPGRRVVRAAGAGHRRRSSSRPRSPRRSACSRRSARRSTASRSTSATAARCSCSTTSSRSSPGRRSSPTSCARRPS